MRAVAMQQIGQVSWAYTAGLLERIVKTFEAEEIFRTVQPTFDPVAAVCKAQVVLSYIAKRTFSKKPRSIGIVLRNRYNAILAVCSQSSAG